MLINRSFLGVDITDENKFKNFTERFQNVNIVILNHIISEIRKVDNFEKGLQTIFKTLPREAVILVIDINHSDVISAIDKVFSSTEFKLQKSKRETGRLEYEEQKADMKTWYGKLARDPKIKWDVFIGIYVIKSEIVDF